MAAPPAGRTEAAAPRTFDGTVYTAAILGGMAVLYGGILLLVSALYDDPEDWFGIGALLWGALGCSLLAAGAGLLSGAFGVRRHRGTAFWLGIVLLAFATPVPAFLLALGLWSATLPLLLAVLGLAVLLRPAVRRHVRGVDAPQPS